MGNFKKYLFLLFIIGCSPSDDFEYIKREGYVNFSISVQPQLNGIDVFSFKSGEILLEFETGQSWLTSPMPYLSNQDLTFEVFVSSSNQCYTVTIEPLFEGKRFERKEFLMGRNGNQPCKDGLEKSVIIKTPK